MAMAANKGPQFNNNTQFNNNAQFNNSNSKGGFNNRDRGGFNNCGRGNNKGGFSPRGGYNQNQVSYNPNTSSYPQQLNPNFPNPNPNCPTCQICYKPSHTTIDCTIALTTPTKVVTHLQSSQLWPLPPLHLHPIVEFPILEPSTTSHPIWPISQTPPSTTTHSLFQLAIVNSYPFLILVMHNYTLFLISSN